MHKKIILVNGWAGSGKDTFSDYLKSKYNYTKLWFSYPLKLYVARKYNLHHRLFLTQEGKAAKHVKTGKTLRDLLIQEASNIRKNDDAYFANRMVEKIKKIDSSKIVISDWRFKTEINTLKQMLPDYCIKTIQIKRFEQPSILDDSEFNLDDFKFDYIIDNSHGLNKLYLFIDENINYFL